MTKRVGKKMRNLDIYLERYKMLVHVMFKQREPRTIAHTGLSRKINKIQEKSSESVIIMCVKHTQKL